MENIYKYSITVEEDAIDKNHHVNNVSYIQWMQDSAISHAKTLGFDFTEHLKNGTTWVAKSHQIDYLRPAFFKEEIDVFTWISDINKSKFTREYKFSRKSDNKVLARAKTDWIYFDTKANRPFKVLPDDVSTLFTIVNKKV